MTWIRSTVVVMAVLFVGYITAGKTSDDVITLAGSSHLSEVVGTNYEQLAPPEDALLFRWDFSGKNVYTYRLEQVSESSSSLMKDKPGFPTGMTTSGDLDIKYQGDGTGKVVLRDMTMTMEGWGKDDSDNDVTHRSEPVVVQGMQEDGTFGAGKNQLDATFRLLLPLPVQPLKVGDRENIPFRIPVNVMGSPLEAQGTVSVVFSGLVYIRGHQCAQLDSQIDVQDIELPEEITATFHVGVSGQGRYYYEVDERRLLEAKVALMTSMKSSFPTPEGVGSSGQDTDGDSEMSMTSDTLIRLSSD